ESYFSSLATILACSSLPDRVHTALCTLEVATSPENRPRLEDAIQRRIPCVSLTDCAVDRALELWFLVPEELSQFQTNWALSSPEAQSSSGEERVQGEEAQNPASSIEHSTPGSPTHSLTNSLT